jgi:ribosome-binding factor A
MKTDQQKPSHRIEKVNALLQQLVGEIILTHVDIYDALVTVSKVEASRDLKWAKIWISIVGANDSKSSDKKIMETLTKNLYEIQGEVNRRLAMKIVPRLQFFLDTAPRYVQHINELIEQVHKEDSGQKNV